MRIVMFYHSLVSDWNHGNAHFLRGVATELLSLGHSVRIFEPRDGWSSTNLLREHGDLPVANFHSAYPHLNSIFYDSAALDLDEALRDADLVIVHEWNDPALVARIGRHRISRGEYLLFFHDTHHRSISAPEDMTSSELPHSDGVLVFGNAIQEIYLRNGWSKNVFTWHEAADTRVFRPTAPARENSTTPAAPAGTYAGDLVWIGNWGDGERSRELEEFLIEPVKQLGLRARVHGVRYPDSAIRALAQAGIEYAGWLPNYEAPQVFSRFRVTVHIPRRMYVNQLPGIPTIRVFEALACGIPLVCSPWPDVENLFTPGQDYLVAADGAEMKRQLSRILSDPQLASSLAANGRKTILARHTCAHRARQLLAIYENNFAAVRENA